MVGLGSWGDIIVASLQQVWVQVISFLPQLIGAIIVFIIGWIVAVALGKIVEKIITVLRVDHVLRQLEIEHIVERAGWKLNAGAFIGGLVKWFLIIAFLLAAVDIIQLNQVSSFLGQVLAYIPNVIVAAIILVIAAVLANFAEKTVRGSIAAVGYHGAIAGIAVRWAIWIFAIFGALDQLQVFPQLVQAVLSNLALGIALAFAIAFGWGGKEAAADFIEKVRSDIRR